jgi:GrpB-like predicted nucleotidyltransferase (UPF0157 family)
MLIQKYDPIWAKNFNDLKKVFQNALLDLTIEIEHVGSTSVVGLAAKPIIDIDLIYSNQADFQKIKNSLSKLGYDHNGDQGIFEREVFKRKDTLKKHPILDKLKHHLYVCIYNSVELRRHILFRDFLRKNEWSKKEYQNLKIELAKKVNHDQKKYAALKEIHAKEWIQSIVELAKKENEKKCNF